jgi:transposase
MRPTYFTGIDLHRRSLTATTLDADGAAVASARMPCRADALRVYFAQQPGQHRAAVECTTGWYWVHDALADTVDLRLAHAKGVKAIAAAKVKTDSADARMLAHLLRADLLPEAHVIADDLRPLRDVLRTRLRLVERRSGALNSIARLLEKRSVYDVAELDALGRLQAQCHLEQAELLHQQIKALEKALHPHLVPDADVQRLLRVPGVGKAVAFTIRLEVDDVGRFPTERQFFSYCRVVPGADNSGDRARHKRSRDGNRYLKMAFSHAAVRTRQAATPCCRLQQRVLPHGGQEMRRISSSLLVPRCAATSLRIAFSVPTRSGLCSGTVTWCSPSSDCRVRRTWLPLCRVCS